VKTKIITGIILIPLLSLMISNCSFSAQSQEVYELTYASMDNAEESMIKVINTAWANWLEHESKGRIKIKFLLQNKLLLRLISITL